LKEFSTLIKEAYPGLKKVALRLCNFNHDDAEDLVQKAVLKAFEKQDSYQEDNFGGWVSTIMKNLFLDEVRKQKGKEFVDIDDEIIPSNDSHKFFEVRDVMNGIKTLSQKCQHILALIADGNKYDEIANQLSMPIGSVMSSLLRCRQNLQKHLYGN